MLAGCATSDSFRQVERQLPPAPTYARPVEVADPREGEDPVNVAARERAGRVKANGVIVRFGKWYGCVKGSYASKREKACK